MLLTRRSVDATPAVTGNAVRNRSEADLNEVNLIGMFIAPQKKLAAFVFGRAEHSGYIYAIIAIFIFASLKSRGFMCNFAKKHMV